MFFCRQPGNYFFSSCWKESYETGWVRTLRVEHFGRYVRVTRGDDLLRKTRLKLWELLRPCCQWCANGCNNSQQCWYLPCIMGRIQPIRLGRLCVMRVRGPNIEDLCKRIQHCCASRFGLHRTNERLGVGDLNVWLVSNFAQQLPTTSNRVCRRTQHVTCNMHRDFASCVTITILNIMHTLKSWKW